MTIQKDNDNHILNMGVDATAYLGPNGIKADHASHL